MTGESIPSHETDELYEDDVAYLADLQDEDDGEGQIHYVYSQLFAEGCDADAIYSENGLTITEVNQGEEA